MARSTYIYIVQNENEIIGAYTVKREMLYDLSDPDGETVKWTRAIRMRDSEMKDWTDITEEVKVELRK
jgi:hypothetical protein